MEGNRGICVQCGCHLENCFRFCPKCGMQLIMHKEVNGLGGGGNSQVRSLNVSNLTQTRLLQTKAIATPAPSSSSSARTFETTFKLPGFHAYKSSKEKERRGFNIRGKEKKKRHIEAQSVVILVGVMGANKKPKRCETLPVQVQTTATPEAIIEAAVTKHIAFNKRFNGDHTYRLVYRDGTKVRYIPGTNPPEAFVLMRYKEASGFGYSKIAFFLEVRNVIAELREVIEPDSNSDDDDGDDNFAATASRPTFVENESVQTSQKCKEDQCEVNTMIVVNCPTCDKKYPIHEIEEHADVCADSSVEHPDPLPVDKMASVATPTFKGKVDRRIISVNTDSLYFAPYQLSPPVQKRTTPTPHLSLDVLIYLYTIRSKLLYPPLTKWHKFSPWAQYGCFFGMMQ